MGRTQIRIIMLCFTLLTEPSSAGEVADEASALMQAASEKLHALGKPSTVTVEVEITGVLRGPHNSSSHLLDDTNVRENSTEAGVKLPGQGQR